MKTLAIAIAACAVLVVGARVYSSWANARVIRELRADPDGARARQTMLLTLPSGRSLPVNYLREGKVVYAAADFPWWHELRGGGGRGSVLIRGETLHGHVRAAENDRDLRASVFPRLRPTAPSFLGTLVVVELD